MARSGRRRLRRLDELVAEAYPELDPDEAVQEAIRLVFALFEDAGSALAVVRHFAAQHLQIPTRHGGGARDGELLWKPLHT